MKLRNRFRPAPGTVLALIALIVAGGGVAVAAIPAASGTITACYADSRGSAQPQGTLRVVDAEAGGTCAGGETKLSWNAVGPKGPAGPAGPAGTAKAYARISVALGTVSDAKGITQSMVSKASGNLGVICFRNLPFTPTSIQVTAVPRYGFAENNDITVNGTIYGGAAGCPGLGTDSAMGFVTAWNGPGGIDGPAPFAGDVQVWFE